MLRLGIVSCHNTRESRFPDAPLQAEYKIFEVSNAAIWGPIATINAKAWDFSRVEAAFMRANLIYGDLAPDHDSRSVIPVGESAIGLRAVLVLLA